MKFNVTFFCLVFCFVKISAQDKEKVDAVLLGAYQMEQCDWSELESKYNVEKATVRDFVSHQYTWVLNNLVLNHQPEYCIIHAGIEDFFLGVSVDLAISKYEKIIDKLQNVNIKCILSNMFPFPLSSGYDEKIKEINTKLQELAIEKHVAFIDAYQVVKNLNVFENGSYLLNNLGVEVWNSLIINELSKKDRNIKPEELDFDFMTLSAKRIDRIIKESPEKVKICMLGNSITEQGEWNALVNGNYIRNCGQGGYTTGQILWHIDTTVIAANPTHCFVMGGINDFSVGLDHEVVFDNYVKIIEKLEQAGIIPVIQSTLFQEEERRKNNEQVKLLNIKLKEFCAKKNLDYLDVNSVLSQNDSLIMDYSTDGTHLNATGYERWAEILVKYLKKEKIGY